MDRYSVIVSQRADEMLVKHARFLAQVSVPAATRRRMNLDAPERNPFHSRPKTLMSSAGISQSTVLQMV